MNKLILIITILIISMSPLLAQHDIKLNIFGAALKDYGIGYEYVINDQISAGVFTNIVKGFPYKSFQNWNNTVIASWRYDYSAFKITPEFRFYINPDFGADSRYFSAYLRYNNETFKDLKYNTYDNHPLSDKIYDFNNSIVVLGLTTGKKWMFNSGIYIETMWGVGKTIISSQNFSDREIEKDVFLHGIENYYYNFTWDYRLQISVGYRIGGY